MTSVLLKSPCDCCKEMYSNKCACVRCMYIYINCVSTKWRSDYCKESMNLLLWAQTGIKSSKYYFQLLLNYISFVSWWHTWQHVCPSCGDVSTIKSGIPNTWGRSAPISSGEFKPGHLWDWVTPFLPPIHPCTYPFQGHGAAGAYPSCHMYDVK